MKFQVIKKIKTEKNNEKDFFMREKTVIGNLD